MSGEGNTEKDNKRSGDSNIGLAPKKSKSVTTSLASLQVANGYSESEESEEEIISNISTEDNKLVMATILFGDPHPSLDVPAVYADIENLMLTSKHYTSRDKQEIIAQKKIWLAVPGLMTITKDNAPDRVYVEAGIAAKKQMVLYAMVGRHGWDVALRTLKGNEGSSMGLPEPILVPVTYIKAEKTYSKPYNGMTYKQDYGAMRGQSFSFRGRGRSGGGGRRY